MTQFSFDAGNRLPLLDIMPVSKPGRAGGDSSDPFDSHLNRASSSPTSPAAATASTVSPASSGSRPPKSSSSDSASPDSSADESTPAKQSASDTPDHGDKATSSSADAPETNQSLAKQGDADQEKDHEGDDDVVLSDESAAVVQQVAVVAAKAEVKVGEETAEGVKNVDAPEEKESPAGHDATQTKPKKQVNQAQQAAPSNSGNKAAATEAAKASVPAEAQPTETAQAVPEASDLDTTTVSEAALAGDVAEVPDAKSLSVKPSTTTSSIKEGQTDEVVDVVENQAESIAPQAQDATDDKQPDETTKLASSTNSVRATNPSAVPDSADHAGQQAQFQQESVAVNSELPPEANSGSDASSDQGGANSEQRSEQQTPAASGNKSPAGTHTTSENSPVTRQLASATEAPVLRAENSTSTTSSTSGTEATSAADRARFVHRVYRALHIAHERGGEVRLRLSPPELGNLTLELKLHDGAMIAHIEAETSAARTLLLDNLSVLKERLAAQDIKVERFDVELRDQSQQHSPDGQPQDSDPGRNTRYVLKKTFMNGGKAAEEGGSSGVRPTTTSGQLNVII